MTYPGVEHLDDLLDWLEFLRAQFGGEAPAVYGGSFGGLIAQAWLRRSPATVGDVVMSGVGPPDVARAAKNQRLLPWFSRLPMPAWLRVVTAFLGATPAR